MDKAQCASFAYLKCPRGHGSGPFRLNQSIVPNPDIYSLLLSSQFRLEIVDKHRVMSKIRQEAEDKNVANYVENSLDLVKKNAYGM